ncbi:hypothetical protein BSEG_04622 [Phocaeicola dorei 5_1_36/D4]|jgi:hypothetical protein|nr:hypothetical protein BSEG_04622 [Phocaeicola dorei 5_1_36/D4]
MLYTRLVSATLALARISPTVRTTSPRMVCSSNPNTCSTRQRVLDFFLLSDFCSLVTVCKLCKVLAHQNRCNLVAASCIRKHFQIWHKNGRGFYRAAANGNSTCLEPFHEPRMSLFQGQLTAIVQSDGKQGMILFEAEADGVTGARLELVAQ